MRIAEGIFKDLQTKYGGRILLSEVIHGEHITAIKNGLPKKVRSLNFTVVDGREFILVNSKLTRSERRQRWYEELYHIIRRRDTMTDINPEQAIKVESVTLSRKIIKASDIELLRATYFSYLCRTQRTFRLSKLIYEMHRARKRLLFSQPPYCPTYGLKKSKLYH